jgi:uncharacterized membrane protein YdbT with pleckstrin-like domain
MFSGEPQIPSLDRLWRPAVVRFARMEMLPDEIVIWEGHPTWRATLSFHFKGFLLAIGLTVVLVLLRLAGIDISIAIIVLVFLAGVGLTVVAGWIHRFFTQYTITTKRLNIRRGILSKTESSTNVDRIQNITVHQSPVDRIMRVGVIDFDTATDDPSHDFSFTGVDNPQSLRERIMRARDNEKSALPSDGQGGLA